MDGTEKSLFKIVGSTMKHFASYVYLKALQAGESIRLRVYNKVDDVSHWKLDGDVTDSVSTNNGTVTNISSWVSQWKFDGDVLDSVGSNNGTITYNTNLKRLYKFESNLNDSTTSAANGTVTGTSTYITGKEGSAFSFDGASYISASDTALPAGNTARSISFWYKPLTTTNGDIVSWGTNSTNQLFRVEFVGLHIRISNATTSFLDSIATLVVGTWYYVTVTYDGTTITVYINGVLDSTALPAAQNTTLSGTFNIGSNLGGAVPVSAVMDEVRIYNISLTSAQVKALYMNGKFAQSHTFDNGEIISVGNPTNLQFDKTNPLSISLWTKWTGNTESGLFSKGGGGATGYDLHWLGGQISFRLWDTGDHAIYSPLVYNDGNWHHIVGTYDGSSNATGIKLYIDGSLVVSGISSVIGTITNASNVVIGSYSSGGNTFTGQIDEVRVYNAALTPTQVTGLYNYTGSNYVTPLPIGNALSLDGSSYVTIPNETPYHWERTQAFTIAFWVKSSSMPAQSTMYYKFSGGGAGHLYILNASGYPQLLIRNTPTTNDLNVQTNNNVIDGTWHNIIVTYDGSSNASNVKFYIDGVLKTTTVNSNTLSATVVNTVQPVLGAQTGGGNPYTGLLDEVQIYNYVVSSAEINAINAGRFGNTHPIGLWHFDGDLYDYSGQGSTGSPTGTMTYVTGALSGSYNVPNTHFNFDGSEYVTVGNPSNIQFELTSPLSIEFWVRTISTAGNNTIINKFNDTSGWLIYMDGSGNVNFVEANVINTNDFAVGSTGTPINDGLWHQVIVTYDGSTNPNNVNFYIDGVLKTKSVGRNGLTKSIINANNITLGVYASINTATFFSGELDDVRIYNRALSSSEVSDLYTYPDSAMKSLVYDKTYTGVVSDAKFVPFLPGNQYMVTCQQLSGINRIITWDREEVS